MNNTVKTNKQLKVTQVSSNISCTFRQKKTLIGLGLKKINAVTVLNDTLSVRGMIKKVQHLIDVKNL